MQALVLTEYRKLELHDVDRPTVGPNDVLVRVAACGICGSDVHGYDGSSGRRVPPIIMGHEAAGTSPKSARPSIASSVGDRVTFDSTISCGRCEACRRGNVNLCDNRRVLGVSCGDYRQHGAFAEFVAVPQQHSSIRCRRTCRSNTPLSSNPCRWRVHAVIGCAIQPGERAVVVGSGMIGLLVIQALRSPAAARSSPSISMTRPSAN